MPKIFISRETFAELRAIGRPEEAEILSSVLPSANGLFEFEIGPDTYARLIRYQLEGENLSDALFRMIKTAKGEIS